MAKLETSQNTPALRASAYSHTIAHPLIWGGQLPQPLAGFLLVDDSYWVGNYLGFLAHPDAPNLSTLHHGAEGSWVHVMRSHPASWTPARQLALLLVRGWRPNVYAASWWGVVHDLTLYGQLHRHTAVPFRDDGGAVQPRLAATPLGIAVNNLRAAWAAFEGRTQPVNKAWHPQLAGVFTQGLPGFAKQLPRGRGTEQFRESLVVAEFTPLHTLMQRWAPAYYVRATSVPPFLLTPEQLHATLPRESYLLLAKLVEQPDYVASLPYWAQVAVAQLMLAPPAELFRGEALPPEWLPPGCLGRTTAQLKHLTALPLAW